MGERRTKLVPIRVDYTCDHCGGTLQSTGITKTWNPPWFVHVCLGCMKTTDMRNLSGQVVYEEAEADAD